jgi:Protein of unknown function (DUF3800)
MFLAERFQHLLAAEDDVGMIVVDSRFREDDARLRRFFADLTHNGTPYSKLDRIVEGLFLGPSHYSIGLQSADLVVAITAAAERGGGQARGFLKTLLPRFACHPATGELDGVGIERSRSRFAGRGRRPDYSNRRLSNGDTEIGPWPQATKADRSNPGGLIRRRDRGGPQTGETNARSCFSSVAARSSVCLTT